MRKLLLALVTVVVLAAGIGLADGTSGETGKSCKDAAACCCSKSCAK